MSADKELNFKPSLEKLLTVIGCDYSAAMPRPIRSGPIRSGTNESRPNATWTACGKLEIAKANGPQLTASTILHIQSLENIGSDRLLDNLLGLSGRSTAPPEASSSNSNSNSSSSSSSSSNSNSSSGSGSGSGSGSSKIIGLDFPFSFPRPFAEILLGADPAGTWADLAAIVSKLTFPELLAQVRAAKPIIGGEIKRLTDSSTAPKAQSPLHQINPGMLKMTWQGMHLLLALQQKGFIIQPFALSGNISGQTETAPVTFQTTVMEVYPAAVLKSLELPWRKYKGADPEAKQLRQFILNNLLGRGDKLRSVNKIAMGVPELELPRNLEQLALANDDALDAVIAALGAAIAYLNPGLTAPPWQISADLIALEGWIYVPYPQTMAPTS